MLLTCFQKQFYPSMMLAWSTRAFPKTVENVSEVGGHMLTHFRVSPSQPIPARLIAAKTTSHDITSWLQPQPQTHPLSEQSCAQLRYYSKVIYNASQTSQHRRNRQVNSINARFPRHLEQSHKARCSHCQCEEEPAIRERQDKREARGCQCRD